MQGVQRFLSGHKNEVRAAVLSGPVKPITDAVIQKPIARQGSSSAGITGTFTGAEEAEYQLEVLDTIPTAPLVTAPIFTGVGNGELSDVAVTGLGARTIEVELSDLGHILTAASADLQGIQLLVKTPGDDGNNYYLRVDRSGIVHTVQQFSLLADLEAGTAAKTGPEFDWDTALISSTGVVPDTAHRISFGADRSNVYVQYKKQVEGEYSYVFEPAIKVTIPEKTLVNFVSGTYTIRLYEDVLGVETLRETYSGVVTLYDLLNAIKQQSTLLTVVGAVALDRQPGGQALLELSLNTDARYVSNTGSGSEFAKGFTEVVIDPSSPTELIEATCIAAEPKDSAGAGIGHELWQVRGSVSGLIRDSVASGELVRTSTFEARIPQRVPEGYSALNKGEFGLKEVIYNNSRRTGSEDDDSLTPPPPPICLDSMTLGLNATEQTITFVYKRRPADDACSCTPDTSVALSPLCLGILTNSEGGNTMAYDATTVTRLIALYDWAADTVRNNSGYFNDGPYVAQDPFVSQPANNPLYPTKANFAFVSLFKMIEKFENVLAEVDKLEAGAYRTAAEAAWDSAVTEFQDDVDTHLSGMGVSDVLESEVFEAAEALADGDAVSIYEVGSGVFKARKAIEGDVKYGFVKAAVLLGADATVYYVGENDAISSTESYSVPGPASQWGWKPSIANPGKWVKTGAVFTGGDPEPIQNYELNYVSATNGYKPFTQVIPDANALGYAILADRHNSRLQWVLISGGISPLGKSNADTTSGDGCWQDRGGDYWWEVTGGDGAQYAPAFTGFPYYSAKKYPGGVVVNGMTTPSEGYYTTKEFGLIIDITCPDNLVVGDTFVLVIGNAGVEPTYQKGDKLQLGVVSKQDIAFFGGNDGDNVQTWLVTDSVDGPRDPYLLDTDTDVPYDDGQLEFLIEQGTIPFVKGDKFSFAVEGGHFKWRKVVNGVAGSWSASTDIDDAPIVLDSGLSLQFTLGTSPAFYTGDLYKFTALQPYALSNIIKPDFDMWQWGAENPAELELDFGSVKSIEAIGFAYHSIPLGATVVVEGGVSPGVYTWNHSLTPQADVMGLLLDTAESARYVRITIEDAEEAGIGWLYLGPALSFTHSAQVQINREYKVNRSSGVNPSSVFKGIAVGSQIQWPEGYLKEEDYVPLLEMTDWLKRNNDEALMFFPQHTRQTEIILGTIFADEIVFNDVFSFQPNDGLERRISCTIPLKGVAFR